MGSKSGASQAEAACLAISEVNAYRHWKIKSVVSPFASSATKIADLGEA